jgi:hypothetical protein
MATGRNLIRLARVAAWVAGSVAGALVVLLGAVAAAALMLAVAARGGLLMLDGVLGFSRRTRLAKELPVAPAPDPTE